MSYIFGWVQGSDMPSTYIHLSGREVDNALFKLYGLPPRQKRQKKALSSLESVQM
jgi:hypothetical protein